MNDSSLRKLETCHVDLQRVVSAVDKKVGLIVLVGHRTKEEQDKAFAEGRSQKRWPNGEHNKFPSTAVDIAPLVPTGLNMWDVHDLRVRCKWWELCYCMLRTAENFGIPVRWGMDWNGDGDITDTRLQDWPHWEMKNA